MTQLTIRGFDKALERRLREVARRQRVSLNKAALALMRKGAGLDTREPADVVGSSLDHLFGTWTAEEARGFRAAVRAMERLDPDLWK